MISRPIFFGHLCLGDSFTLDGRDYVKTEWTGAQLADAGTIAELHPIDSSAVVWKITP